MFTMICDLPGNADPRSNCCWNCKRKVMCFRGRVRSHWIRSSIGATTFFFIEFYHGMYHGMSPPVLSLFRVFLKSNSLNFHKELIPTGLKHPLDRWSANLGWGLLCSISALDVAFYFQSLIALIG